MPDRTRPIKNGRPPKSPRPRPKPQNPNPPFEPKDEHRKLVSLASAMGYTQPQIAALITPQGISVDTLTKYFAPELATGADRANALVAHNLFTIATDRNHKHTVTAAIFWLKTRGRWKTADGLDLDGVVGADGKKTGGALPVKFTLRLGERDGGDAAS